jgi:hypothetical protein
MITNDAMYEDEIGYKIGEIQKRKFVETDAFSVDKRIKIINQTIEIMNTEDIENT